MTKAGVAALLVFFVRFNVLSQEIAVFKIQDASREFMFQFSSGSTRPDSVDGIETIFAQHFNVIKSQDPKIVFTNVLWCRAVTNVNSVLIADQMERACPTTSRVLLRGRWMRLSDLNEQSLKSKSQPFNSQSEKVQDNRVPLPKEPAPKLTPEH